MTFSVILVNCEWDEWNEGECSKQCGGGKRTNTRAPRVNAAYGGKANVLLVIQEVGKRLCKLFSSKYFTFAHKNNYNFLEAKHF